MTKEEKELLIEQTVNSGVPPLSLKYTPVYYCSGSNLMALRSTLLINSVLVGVMDVQQYQYIANVSTQSVELAKRAVREAVKAIRKLECDGVAFEWISLYIPPKIFTEYNVCNFLKGEFEKLGFNEPSKICLEIPPEILYDEIPPVREAVLDLKLLGVRTMLWGFADEFTPALRIAEIMFDYVVMDVLITEKMRSRNTDRISKSMISYARTIPSEVIVVDVDNNELLEKFSRADCVGYFPKDVEPRELEEALPTSGEA